MANLTSLDDIFTSLEAKKILKNKYVLFIGDSVVRGMYKDLVRMLQNSQLLHDDHLKEKGEFYFENDQLLEGGQKAEMNNSISYTEVREYKSPFHLVRFYFITRCYSDYVMTICENIKNDTEKPDLLVMNSGCWDLTRYGRLSFKDYQRNLPYGIYNLVKILPSHTVFLWTTTMPLAKCVTGGFASADCDYFKSGADLRSDVLDANKYAANVIRNFKLDLLDLHYYFHKQTHRRKKDGIHWDPESHRRISNLILNHLCEAWNIKTNGRDKIKNNRSLIELGANEDNDPDSDDFNKNNTQIKSNNNGNDVRITNGNNKNNSYRYNNNNNHEKNKKNNIDEIDNYNNDANQYINYGLGTNNNFGDNVDCGLDYNARDDYDINNNNNYENGLKYRPKNVNNQLSSNDYTNNARCSSTLNNSNPTLYFVNKNCLLPDPTTQFQVPQTNQFNEMQPLNMPFFNSTDYSSQLENYNQYVDSKLSGFSQNLAFVDESNRKRPLMSDDSSSSNNNNRSYQRRGRNKRSRMENFQRENQF